MRFLKSILAFTFVVSAMLFAAPANAISVVGVAVAQIGHDPDALPVGITDFSTALGGQAIKFYIPLGNADGTYGVGGFGTHHDHGNGGGVLSMILAFKTINPFANGLLSIRFEDLDLTGINDPSFFVESIEVFNQNGASLLSTNTAIPGVIGGNFSIQTLSLGLGSLIGFTDTYYVALEFSSALAFGFGTNSAEFLIATLEEVPLPAAMPLYGTGLAIMGFIGWYRNRKAASK